MDRFLGKLKKKAGGSRNKAGTDKARQLSEEKDSLSPSLSSEQNETASLEPSISWHSDKDQPRQAFETSLRPPTAPSGDRHSNYRPYRRAPETPPVGLDFPLGFSSLPYESTKKSYPPPRTSKGTEPSPAPIRRKELPKKEKLPNNERRHRATESSETAEPVVLRVDNEPKQEPEPELELESEPESEPEPEPRTSTSSDEIEGSTHSVEGPSLDSKTSIISLTKAEQTAELLAKKYARLIHQKEELHAKKYKRIIHHREELEARGILWPTNPSTHEFPDDEGEKQVYEFPQFVPKPLVLRNQREPSSEGHRSNQRQISTNGPTHDYEAAKLESWRRFYEKGEMMETLHNEIDEYLGALMFKRLLKETNGAATGQPVGNRTEVAVREYWDGVRGFLGLEFKDEGTRN
ncbi:hypothetical protein V490_09254 [Pseudogymnoascus sp. VKM F-3557]|nr:hypothetical protein V490_09254 [Pseudogymnoascus sp. VKM F-3557]